MKSWLFTDYASGEDFIVEAETRDEAKYIANEYFADPDEPEEISEYDAECMGLDTY